MGNTFYNGKQNYPLEKTLRLSDAFLSQVGKYSVELTVRVININADKMHEMLEKCPILKEYSLFVQEVRKYEGDEDALKKAIQSCIKRGILSEYLKRKGSEVKNMLIAEYSYEKDMQVKQEEVMQIGIEQGMLLSGKVFQLIKKSPNLTDGQAAEVLGCTPEDVAHVRRMFEV